MDGWKIFFRVTSLAGSNPDLDESTLYCETQCVFIPLYVRLSLAFLHVICILIFLIKGVWLPHLVVYTGYTQQNGAVSKVNKEFISHFTRAQRTPSAAATVQVSHALPAVRLSCLMRGRGASFQDGVAAGKRFLCAPF